jgi:uncharacterized protein (DUF433 family)
MSIATAQLEYPHVARDAGVAGGQPVVAGTRIPLAALVRAHQLGLDFEEILVQYPSLRPVDLHAAFVYYLDHKDEMDALLREAATAPPGADVIGP